MITKIKEIVDLHQKKAAAIEEKLESSEYTAVKILLWIFLAYKGVATLILKAVVGITAAAAVLIMMPIAFLQAIYNEVRK